MAYKNQNYMTNRKIKEAVDKNQKNYQPQEEEIEEEKTIKATFVVTINEEPYEGATVTIGDKSQNTNADGITIFEGLPNENATATISSDDFDDITRNIVKDEEDQTFNISITRFNYTTPTMEEEEGEW